MSLILCEYQSVSPVDTGPHPPPDVTPPFKKAALKARKPKTLFLEGWPSVHGVGAHCWENEGPRPTLKNLPDPYDDCLAHVPVQVYFHPGPLDSLTEERISSPKITEAATSTYHKPKHLAWS